MDNLIGALKSCILIETLQWKRNGQKKLKKGFLKLKNYRWDVNDMCWGNVFFGFSCRLTEMVIVESWECHYMIPKKRKISRVSNHLKCLPTLWNRCSHESSQMYSFVISRKKHERMGCNWFQFSNDEIEKARICYVNKHFLFFIELF